MDMERGLNKEDDESDESDRETDEVGGVLVEGMSAPPLPPPPPPGEGPPALRELAWGVSRIDLVSGENALEDEGRDTAGACWL